MFKAQKFSFPPRGLAVHLNRRSMQALLVILRAGALKISDPRKFDELMTNVEHSPSLTSTETEAEQDMMEGDIQFLSKFLDLGLTYESLVRLLWIHRLNSFMSRAHGTDGEELYVSQ